MRVIVWNDFIMIRDRTVIKFSQGQEILIMVYELNLFLNLNLLFIADFVFKLA